MQQAPIMASDFALNSALEVTVAGRSMGLEWHKCRLKASDRPFDEQTMRRGLAIGARLEIDLQPLADGKFAILHDSMLGEETNGSGPLSALTSEEVRKLRVRDANGVQMETHPMLFEDAAQLIDDLASGDTRIHLDLKATRALLANDHRTHFLDAAKPIARWLELGGRDHNAVKYLAKGLEDLHTGHDPLMTLLEKEDLSAAAFAKLLEDIRKKTDGVAAYYLHHATVTSWMPFGVNPIEILKADGAEAVIWTIDMAMPEPLSLLTSMAKCGADRIITDDPLALVELARTGTGPLPDIPKPEDIAGVTPKT